MALPVVDEGGMDWTRLLFSEIRIFYFFGKHLDCHRVEHNRQVVLPALHLADPTP